MTGGLNTNFLIGGGGGGGGNTTVETVQPHTVEEVTILSEMVQHRSACMREKEGKYRLSLDVHAVLRYDVVICMMACHWLLAGLRVINMGC